LTNASASNSSDVLGIAGILLRYFGVDVEGRLRFIMVTGIVIGLVGIVLASSTGIPWPSRSVSSCSAPAACSGRG
jgi:hypothetical protein